MARSVISPDEARTRGQIGFAVRIYFVYILAMTAEEFLPPAPRLRVEPLLRFQRYRDLDKVAPAIREVAEEMVRAAEKLAVPKVAFMLRQVHHVGPATLAVADGPTFSGRCFTTHISQASQVVCFLITIGPDLDDRVTEMASGDELLEALFLDTAGWLAIEDALRAFRRHLAGRVRPRGLRLSPRLGPGFLDWPLTDQQEFFSIFSGVPLPVKVSEHSVMTPKKSISGLFGLLPSV